MAVQQTGLTQLGNALLQGSGDYANIQLRRQAEERQRAQQIADLQDQRRYAEDQRSLERNQRIDDATLQVLLSEGWLKPTDARNPQAIQAAADARQKRLGVTREREEALPGKLQSEADYLGKQEAELAAAEDALNAVLSEPQPAPPTQAEVRNLAIRKTGKKVPSDAEINDMMGAAAEEIMNQRYLRWSMDKEDAKVQIPLLRSQRMSLRQSLSGLLQQGFVPNRTPPPTPAASLNMPPAGGRVATPAERAAAAGIVPAASATAPSPAQALQSQDYGGIMGALPNLRGAGTILSDPIGAGEIALRSAAAVPARALNFIAGGSRRVAEGNAERDAAMADAITRFNAPAAPLPANPFWGGNINAPGRTLSPLPPMQPIQRKSPAFQFGNEYAPGY